MGHLAPLPGPLTPEQYAEMLEAASGHIEGNPGWHQTIADDYATTRAQAIPSERPDAAPPE